MQTEAAGALAVRVQKCLEAISVEEPVLRAFREIHAERALAEAVRLDGLAPEQRGPLHGLLFSAKETFDAEQALCEWGSRVFAGRRAEADCEVVKRLREAGAILVGITSSSEYALSTAPPTTNPFDVGRTPGASSSGSAAAVGAGILPLALGSQTIGSCIRPAAYCGCYGFKPTVGSISLQGVMPLSGTLDACGLFGATLRNIVDAFAVLGSHANDVHISANENLLPCPIAVVSPWFEETVGRDTMDCIASAASAFERAGFPVTDLSASAFAQDEENCLMTILCYEMVGYHQAARKDSASLLSRRVRAFIDRGLGTSEQDYRRALAAREQMIAVFEQSLPEDGVVLTCATVDVAPLRDAGTGSRAPQRLWTLLGLPCISIPAGFTGGLPQAVQLVGRRDCDAHLLQVAGSLTSALAADTSI